MYIINIISKNSKYIRIQNDNFKKYIKSDYEYIVLNNAIFDKNESDDIENICNELGIKSYKIDRNDQVLNYTGFNNYGQFEHWASYGPTPGANYALNWLSIILSSQLKNDVPVCLIHSDMFFLKEIDLYQILKDNDSVFVPQYRNKVNYIWDGFVIFKDSNITSKLNWSSGEVNGEICDCGGQTHNYLQTNPKTSFIESWNISDYELLPNNRIKFDTHLNGNVRYTLIYDENKAELEDMILNGYKLSDNKSLVYETDVDDYKNYYLNKFLKIKNWIDENKLELPHPIWIDILMEQNSDEFLIMHYKSGTNYLQFQNSNYNELKLKELKKIL